MTGNAGPYNGGRLALAIKLLTTAAIAATAAAGSAILAGGGYRTAYLLLSWLAEATGKLFMAQLSQYILAQHNVYQWRKQPRRNGARRRIGNAA